MIFTPTECFEAGTADTTDLFHMGVRQHPLQKLITPTLPYKVHIDDRVKHGVVHAVVHVEVLVIVLPPGLHRQEPGVAALLIPGNFTGRVDQYLLLRDNSSA